MKIASVLMWLIFITSIILSFISGRYFVVSDVAENGILCAIFAVSILYVAVPLLFFYCAVVWCRTRQRSAVYVMTMCLILIVCVLSIPLAAPFRIGFRAFAWSTAVMQDLNGVTLSGLLSSIRSDPEFEIYIRDDGTMRGTLSPTDYSRLDSTVPARYRPPHVLFYEGQAGSYLVLEWGGPLLGRFGIAYDPGHQVIQEYVHVHECADTIFAVSKR